MMVELFTPPLSDYNRCSMRVQTNLLRQSDLKRLSVKVFDVSDHILAYVFTRCTSKSFIKKICRHFCFKVILFDFKYIRRLKHKIFFVFIFIFPVWIYANSTYPGTHVCRCSNGVQSELPQQKRSKQSFCLR